MKAEQPKKIKLYNNIFIKYWQEVEVEVEVRFYSEVRRA